MYGSETGTLRKLERKYLENFEMWYWKRMEKIKWTKKVTNAVLEHIGGKSTLLTNILLEKPIGMVIF